MKILKKYLKRVLRQFKGFLNDILGFILDLF